MKKTLDFNLQQLDSDGDGDEDGSLDVEPEAVSDIDNNPSSQSEGDVSFLSESNSTSDDDDGDDWDPDYPHVGGGNVPQRGRSRAIIVPLRLRVDYQNITDETLCQLLFLSEQRMAHQPTKRLLSSFLPIAEEQRLKSVLGDISRHRKQAVFMCSNCWSEHPETVKTKCCLVQTNALLYLDISRQIENILEIHVDSILNDIEDVFAGRRVNSVMNTPAMTRKDSDMFHEPRPASLPAIVKEEEEALAPHFQDLGALDDEEESQLQSTESVLMFGNGVTNCDPVPFSGYNPIEIAEIFFTEKFAPRGIAQSKFDLDTRFPSSSLNLAHLINSFSGIFPLDGVGWSMDDMRDCILGLIGTVIAQQRSIDRLLARSSGHAPISGNETKILGASYFKMERLEGVSKLVEFPPYREVHDIYEFGRKACHGIPGSATTSTTQVSAFVNSFWHTSMDPYLFVCASQGHGNASAFPISAVLRESLADLVVVGLGINQLPKDSQVPAIDLVRRMVNRNTNTCLSTAKNQFRAKKSRFATLRADLPKDLEEEGKYRNVDRLRIHMMKSKAW